MDPPGGLGWGCVLAYSGQPRLRAGSLQRRRCGVQALGFRDQGLRRRVLRCRVYKLQGLGWFGDQRLRCAA